MTGYNVKTDINNWVKPTSSNAQHYVLEISFSALVSADHLSSACMTVLGTGWQNNENTILYIDNQTERFETRLLSKLNFSKCHVFIVPFTCSAGIVTVCNIFM